MNLCVWVYVSAQWLVSRCCLVRDWPVCQQEVKRSNTHLQLDSESEIQREREWQRARLTGKERDGRRSSCYNKRRLIHYAKQTFRTHQQLLMLCSAICCTKWFMHFRKNFSWENKVMTKEKKFVLEHHLTFPHNQSPQKQYWQVLLQRLLNYSAMHIILF